MRPIFRSTCYLAALLSGGAVLDGGQVLAENSTPHSKRLHKRRNHRFASPSKAGKTHQQRVEHGFYPVATEDDPYGNEQVLKASDPLEKGNRAIFALNHQFYRFVTKPLAKATVFIFREKGVEALGNVFENAEAPVRIVSSLLQGKITRAGRETEKLVVNSTVGVGGLLKPSDRIASLKNIPSEDVGQTFGTWGVPAGPYLVVPVLGPSSARDLVGKVGDSFLQPTTWIGTSQCRTIVRGSKAVVENPDRMDAYEATTSDALDPYIAMREGFVNYRKAAVDR